MTLQLASMLAPDALFSPRAPVPSFDPYHPFRFGFLTLEHCS
jgi:hypothetical protein